MPYIQSQMAVHIKNEATLAVVEKDFTKVTEDMTQHIKEIQEKLTEILLNDWKNQLKDNGPSQAEFDAKIESGSTVSANTYMLNILKSLNKMHKVLYATLEAGQLE